MMIKPSKLLSLINKFYIGNIEIIRMILDLSKESNKIGLKININKSTILCNLSDENTNVKLGGKLFHASLSRPINTI